MPAVPATPLSFAGVDMFEVMAKQKEEVQKFGTPTSAVGGMPAVPSTIPSFAGVSLAMFGAENDEGKKPGTLSTQGGMPAVPAAMPSSAGATLLEAGKLGTPTPALGGMPSVPSTMPYFAGESLAGLFALAAKKEEEKKLEVGNGEKKPNPFATLGGFGGGTPTPATTGMGGGLFGNMASTASAGLFGSDAKIDTSKKTEGGMFGKKSYEPSKPPSGGLSGSVFGSKPPVTLDAPAASSGDVAYPSLPAAPSSTASTTPAVTTNGNSHSISSAASILVRGDIPPPPPNLLNAQKADYDKLHRIKSLNAIMLKVLQMADTSADWRGAFQVYSQLFEQITCEPAGIKRKEAHTAADGQTSISPKRSKTEEPKPATSNAAKLFGDIVNKNVGTSTPTFGTKGEYFPRTEEEIS